MKTAICEVRFDGYDWRNELYVKSVKTGKLVRVFCNGKWNSMSEEMDRFIKYIDRKPWGKTYKEELTYSLMRELLELSKRGING